MIIKYALLELSLLCLIKGYKNYKCNIITLKQGNYGLNCLNLTKCSHV